MLDAESDVTLPVSRGSGIAIPSRIELPGIPELLIGDRVAAWSQPLTIDSYLPTQPDVFPAFLDTRVYQGSSGKVYPLPFHERISQGKEPHEWQALHLENEYVRLVILPQLGGRIHIGYDKTVGYDFFYRNNVIKPALVGLAGPWISGGVEFNWPQHHRPGTFLPTDWEIEREADGSVTIWCSDHDPLTRMKGMHGIRLRPSSSVVEARVRLYNRTDEPQSFLWWANVAAAVGDNYQSFFPSDVHYVADHARRAMATFPNVDGRYYGVDYSAQITEARPDGDRLDWYRNIPVPTSYMVIATEDDFFGGYDHGVGAGFVHWADRSFAPGKKQWTWGNAAFGQAWDANLTDTDGPYVELMAGAYTNNQPDFSWIAPGETKSFSQYWYPIQGIGPAQQATLQAAIRRDHLADGRMRVGVITTRPAEVSVEVGDEIRQVQIAPGKPFIADFAVAGPVVVREGAEVLVELGQREVPEFAPSSVATEPSSPHEIGSIEELFLTGQYLQQYRHATRSPEPYWREAIRRDPGDIRSHVALGAQLDRAGDFGAAEGHLHSAISRLVSQVPNPADGEAHYRLGITLVHSGNDDRAAGYLAKALWNAAWRVPAGYALARLEARRGNQAAARRHALAVIELDGQHSQAINLLAALGDRQFLAGHLAADPLDQWARDLAGLASTVDAPTLLDVALEYAGIGLVEDALRVLEVAGMASAETALGQVQVGPLVHYQRAFLLDSLGESGAASAARNTAMTVDGRNCLPSRLEDVRALNAADATDGRAAMMLGCWYYDKRRYADAIDAWERALEGQSDSDTKAIASRNLGIAAYNIAHDTAAAVQHFTAARRFSPTNAKLLCEFDQLSERAGMDAAARLASYEQNLELVLERDDLTVRYAILLTGVGRATEARDVILGRRFQPWEGGEGKVLSAWDHAMKALAVVHPESSVEFLEAAIAPPANLGEARHPLANAADLYCLLGDAYAASGDVKRATDAWWVAVGFTGDFRNMSEQPFSDQTVYSIRALRALGRGEEADDIARRFVDYIDELESSPAKVDFFATSLPAMLLFHDDPQELRNREVVELRAQLRALGTSAREPAAPAARGQ